MQDNALRLLVSLSSRLKTELVISSFFQSRVAGVEWLVVHSQKIVVGALVRPALANPQCYLCGFFHIVGPQWAKLLWTLDEHILLGLHRISVGLPSLYCWPAQTCMLEVRLQFSIELLMIILMLQPNWTGTNMVQASTVHLAFWEQPENDLYRPGWAVYWI